MTVKTKIWIFCMKHDRYKRHPWAGKLFQENEITFVFQL